MMRAFRAVLVALPIVLLLGVACSGDDDSSGDGASNGDSSSPTPFIAPPALSTVAALALVDEIEGMVSEPNGALVAATQVPEAELQKRMLLILNGNGDTSGLDDVRKNLENEDRVGAGEYLYNIVRDWAQPSLTAQDTQEIDEETLDRVDLNHSFDDDHSDGMPVSAVYKDAVLKMIELWYGLIGEPEDTPPAS